MNDLPPIMSLLDLQPVDPSDPTRFRMEVTPSLSTPFHFLYGGAGIAGSAEASERATGRPLQWITTQFLGSPSPGDIVELEVNVAVTGRSTTQTQVAGVVDGELMFTSLCAHNVRPIGEIESLDVMPAVPPPDECTEFAEPFANAEASFFSRMTRRVAAGTIEVGEDRRFVAPGSVDAAADSENLIALWCRLDGATIGSAATQSFVADMGPLGVCAKFGLPLGGTSLDNTMRVVDTRESEWVLIDIEVDGYSRSVGHSTARLWSQDGRLLGIAQQSAIIRNSHHERRAPNS